MTVDISNYVRFKLLHKIFVESYSELIPYTTNNLQSILDKNIKYDYELLNNEFGELFQCINNPETDSNEHGTYPILSCYNSELHVLSYASEYHNYSHCYTINRTGPEIGYIYYHPYNFNIDESLIVLKCADCLSLINLIVISIQLNRYFKENDIDEIPKDYFETLDNLLKRNDEDEDNLPSILIFSDENENLYSLFSYFDKFDFYNVSIYDIYKMFSYSYYNELIVYDEIENELEKYKDDEYLKTRFDLIKLCNLDINNVIPLMNQSDDYKSENYKKVKFNEIFKLNAINRLIFECQIKLGKTENDEFYVLKDNVDIDL